MLGVWTPVLVVRCTEHDWGLSGVEILSVWNTPHWCTTCHSCHGHPWACLSAPDSMQFKVIDLQLSSKVRNFFSQMESKSLAYWCESLCGYHSVWRYLTELGLWGKIVSYRTTQKETREIAYQCWSPNCYYFGCALQTFGGTEEKNQLLTQVQDTQKCMCAQQHSEAVWKDSDTKSLITGQAKWHNITTYCDFIGSSTY